MCTNSLWWTVVKFKNQYSIPNIVLSVHPKKKKTIDHEWVEKIGLSTKIVQEVQNVGQPF